MGAIDAAGLAIFDKHTDTNSKDKWTTERVLSIRQWTPTLLSFRTTRYRGFRFTPGHYTRLGLGAADANTGDTVWRPFSLASAAYDDFLEFIAVLVPGGAFSEQLKHLRAGGRLRVSSGRCRSAHKGRRAWPAIPGRPRVRLSRPARQSGRCRGAPTR